MFKEIFICVAVLAVGVGGYLGVRAAMAEPSDTKAVRKIPSVQGVGLVRDTVARSPQRPGYTAWTGAWLLPGGDLATGFVQATGPIDPTKRRLASPELEAIYTPGEFPPERDFLGLELRLKHLRSSDGGRTWETTLSEPFESLGAVAVTPQPTIALPDGTLLRRVNGDDLRQDDSVPHTAFLQRRGPDDSEWSEPQVLLDPRRFTYQISRIRRLSDGRLVAAGAAFRVPATTTPADRNRDNTPAEFLLMVSDDDGTTWRNGMRIPAETGYLPANEWDVAELDNGDLVAVMRTLDDPERRQQVRKQGILRREGDGWVLTEVRPAPFPHSGHPELLKTREGPVLHVATTGVHYTKDGRTWTPLRFAPDAPYRSPYYPRAVQTRDGQIHVFGHVGADDAYGARDQSILMDRFALDRIAD